VLVAGLQRLEAMKALGEATITAIVVGSPQH
jgi:ParB-like chromosome segregation protein Spo0J